MSDDPMIEYSVRELIERLDRKIDQFIVLMNQKAERSDVALIDQRLAAVESKLSDLTRRLGKDERKANERREWRRWVIPTAIALAGAVATCISILIH